jgi:hypothetical protein
METIFLTVLTAVGLAVAGFLGTGVLRALFDIAQGKGPSTSLPLVIAGAVCLMLGFVEPSGQVLFFVAAISFFLGSGVLVLVAHSAALCLGWRSMHGALKVALIGFLLNFSYVLLQQ